MRLNLNPEAEWIDLMPGVRVLCEPATTSVMSVARRDPVLDALPDDAPPDDVALAFAKAVAKVVIREWEGVEGPNGKPVKPSPDFIDAFLDNFAIYNAWQAKYMARWVGLDAEKNGSAPSPSGGSAGARTTAKRAPRGAKSAPRKSTGR